MTIETINCNQIITIKRTASSEFQGRNYKEQRNKQ